MTEKPQALYEAEVKQADIDHHTPTAGAMTGHIVANLVVLENKLLQAKWYVKGVQRITLASLLSDLYDEALTQKLTIGQALVDEGLLVPTTTAEFEEYAMLTEAGVNKYQSADYLIDMFVHDYDTENLFITRAIALSEKEQRPVLALKLTFLLGQNNHRIAELQALLGNSPRTGLDEEDED
ncbi:ferritin-like domain-containing protein [Furfurilactobacillus siliginis]|uniref:DNA starvation/stationary phase protection protein n=1 Tax=Furfurilactobacillus siliginis TaxID=348151 RepID=A0A0R2KVH7_9LACO|nr:ferritin-like domain-containing protein [Furfurilactobacillus siliginis]KRN93518.1 stress induced DNA binding protein [Furfurilactobacillus siliginis]GEK29417.1 DNA starvation/stationary phase protection protein [Furfurilactobacillus siliginis]